MMLGGGGLPAILGQAAPRRWQAKTVRLFLRHTWTTTMGSYEYRDTVHVRFEHDGVVGYGEGAPIVRYKEDAPSTKHAVESLFSWLESVNPWQFAKVMDEVTRRLPGHWAAKAAIDIALMDWVTQRLGIPLYRYFGLDPAATPLTSFSIGIDRPDKIKEKVQEAEPYPILKIKVGVPGDEDIIEAVRSVTNKPIRVDANEGWPDKELALRKIRWLEKAGVELVEQPMPAPMIEETRWLRQRVHVPLIADEAALRPEDLPRLREAYDGVNVKLDKCGGILAAWRMIQLARALGMKVMLGCMVSSSVSITAAAHLAPLVDYADLDGNLLVANDPFVGVRVEHGRLILPDRPGLGVVPVREHNPWA